MSLSQRDLASRQERQAALAAEQAQQVQQRNERKNQLRRAIENRAKYEENRAYLPNDHRRSVAPEIELQPGDEALLAELNADLMSELTPAPAESDVELGVSYADLEKIQATVTRFLDSTPEYFRCRENFKILDAYFLEHNLRQDSIDSFRQAFTETRGQLTPVPKVRVKPEVVYDKMTGEEIPAWEVESLSADEYAARVMGRTTEYSRSKMNFADMFRR